MGGKDEVRWLRSGKWILGEFDTEKGAKRAG